MPTIIEFSCTIKNFVPDTRQSDFPNGDKDIDFELINEWTNQEVKLNFLEDDWDNGSIDLDEISEMFFNEWTQQTGWLFKELVIKLPQDLKYLLSENKDDNKRSEEWVVPMVTSLVISVCPDLESIFCIRKQVIQFVW